MAGSAGLLPGVPELHRPLLLPGQCSGCAGPLWLPLSQVSTVAPGLGSCCVPDSADTETFRVARNFQSLAFQLVFVIVSLSLASRC